MILCDISAEFYLNVRFFIIKVIMYSNCESLISKNRDLFSRIFEFFNEMEREINVINNKIFTSLFLKTRVRRKKISYIIF